MSETIIEQAVVEEENVHTAAELELMQKVEALEKEVKELRETNRQLFIKFGGGNEDPEKSVDELCQEAINRFCESGFDTNMLKIEV